jgi:hypothetical protein
MRRWPRLSSSGGARGGGLVSPVAVRGVGPSRLWRRAEAGPPLLRRREARLAPLGDDASSTAAWAVDPVRHSQGLAAGGRTFELELKLGPCLSSSPSSSEGGGGEQHVGKRAARGVRSGSMSCCTSSPVTRSSRSAVSPPPVTSLPPLAAMTPFLLSAALRTLHAHASETHGVRYPRLPAGTSSTSSSRGGNQRRWVGKHTGSIETRNASPT